MNTDWFSYLRFSKKRVLNFLEKINVVQSYAQSVSENVYYTMYILNSQGFVTMDSSEGDCSFTDAYNNGPKLGQIFTDENGNRELYIQVMKSYVGGFFPKKFVKEFQRLLQDKDKDYILIDHLDPTHKSMNLDREFRINVETLSDVQLGLKSHTGIIPLPEEVIESFFEEIVHGNDYVDGFPSLARIVANRFEKGEMTYITLVDKRPCRNGVSNLFHAAAKILAQLDISDQLLQF